MRPLKLKMSLDVHSLQSLIHDIPTWAQYAAQGISEEAIAGHLFYWTADRLQPKPDFLL